MTTITESEFSFKSLFQKVFRSISRYRNAHFRRRAVKTQRCRKSAMLNFHQRASRRHRRQGGDARGPIKVASPGVGAHSRACGIARSAESVAQSAACPKSHQPWPAPPSPATDAARVSSVTGASGGPESGWWRPRCAPTSQSRWGRARPR